MRMSIYDRPGANAKDLTKDLQGLYVDKPMGYTKFPCELMPVPESWAKGTGNLVHFNEHQVGESSCPSLLSSRSGHSLLTPGRLHHPSRVQVGTLQQPSSRKRCPRILSIS